MFHMAKYAHPMSFCAVDFNLLSELNVGCAYYAHQGGTRIIQNTGQLINGEFIAKLHFTVFWGILMEDFTKKTPSCILTETPQCENGCT